MNKENTKKLFEKYPKIFPKEKRDLGPMHTLMCFGFECGDGWYKVIDDLCFTIQQYVDSTGATQPEAVQVKEKFGTLRFYVDKANSEIYEMIDRAEQESGYTCEKCGQPGKEIVISGWIETRCKKCYEKEIGKKNPVAKNMYTGETGFKPQTQTHKSKKKYSRKKNKKIITKEKDDLN